MKTKEYEIVKNFTYLQYCDYLQNKYGIGKANYFTESWKRNGNASRTNEGLIAHHKYEDHAGKLSDPTWAPQYPYEWQLAENIVYCDCLEHLFLHILICEYPASDKEIVGIGGICDFIVPELNDLYSGWITKQAWRKNCHNLVVNDKDAYLILLKRFKDLKHPLFSERLLLKSSNPAGWSNENNTRLYEEIKNL